MKRKDPYPSRARRASHYLPRGVGFQPWASRFFFVRCMHSAMAVWMSGMRMSGRAFTSLEQSSSLLERFAARILFCSSTVKLDQVKSGSTYFLYCSRHWLWLMAPGLQKL